MRCQALRSDGMRCANESLNGILCEEHEIMRTMNNFDTFRDWNTNALLDTIGLDTNLNISLNMDLGLYTMPNMLGLWNSLNDWSIPVLNFFPIPVPYVVPPFPTFGEEKQEGRRSTGTQAGLGISGLEDLTEYCDSYLQDLRKHNRTIVGILNISRGFDSPKIVSLKGYQRGFGKIDPEDSAYLKSHRGQCVVLVSYSEANQYNPPNGALVRAAIKASKNSTTYLLFVIMDSKGCWTLKTTPSSIQSDQNEKKTEYLVNALNLAASKLRGEAGPAIELKDYLETTKKLQNFISLHHFPYMTGGSATPVTKVPDNKTVGNTVAGF